MAGSVKICTPLWHDGCERPEMIASVDMALSDGHTWQTCVGPQIARNRNRLVDLSREWHLFWDSDIEAPTSAIVRLLSHDVDIVCAAYLARRNEFRAYCAGSDGSGHVGIGSRGLVEVNWVGAGFLLVKTEVFRTLEKPWFRHVILGDDESSEDIGFCIHARRAGYKVYVDCDCVVNHIIGGTDGADKRRENGDC